jgi:hypothetical protein
MSTPFNHSSGLSLGESQSLAPIENSAGLLNYTQEQLDIEMLTDDESSNDLDDVVIYPRPDSQPGGTHTANKISLIIDKDGRNTKTVQLQAAERLKKRYGQEDEGEGHTTTNVSRTPTIEIIA